MISRAWAVQEFKTVARATVFFAVCFSMLMLFKRLILAQYEITTGGLSVALFAALVLGKVVVVLEHVPLGPWVRRHSPIIGVMLRTILYTLGAFIVSALEKAFEARHEAGGFGPGIVWVFEHSQVHHLLANTIAVGSSLLAFNVWCALDEQLGKGTVHRVLFSLPAAESQVAHSAHAAVASGMKG